MSARGRRASQVCLGVRGYRTPCCISGILVLLSLAGFAVEPGCEDAALARALCALVAQAHAGAPDPHLQSRDAAAVVARAPADAADPPPQSRGAADLRKRLVRETRDWGYFRVHQHHWKPLKGLRVLDVGMGQGPLGVVALDLGVRHYTGLDPAVRIHKKPKARVVGSFAPGQMYKEFPFTGEDMMDAFPTKLVLLEGTFDTLRDDPHLARGQFDVVTLFSVSEHLPNLTEVLWGAFNILTPGQLLVFSHHNYYGYSGHHMLPKTPAKFDPKNPRHAEVASWRHILPTSPPYNDTSLNRIRLGDVMAIVAVYFDCAWAAKVGDGDRKALGPSVKEHIAHGISKAELLVNRLYYACARRAHALSAAWLPAVPVHHPRTDGSQAPRPLPPEIADVTASDVVMHIPEGLGQMEKYLKSLLR